ncbi:MAG: zinc ribbon domain-containing protein [Peptococcaceae bacterium]|nr:zinc ribbon domain-containing protein [Peptococcaceae bacterium]
MGFEKFGRKSFTAHTKSAAFVDFLAEGEIRATRCRACGAVYFPPRADCAACFAADMEWVKVEGEGRLVSYTTANYAPTGFEADVPYTLALADFGRVKVFGRMNKEVREEDLKVGLPVKAAVVQLPDGQLTYEFQPA